MAKRDGEFAKTKTDWHRDPRCRALKHPSYKWLNQVLWNLCVKERRETLPSYYTAATLAHEADIDVRTVRKGLALMSQECIGLITINSDQTITVNGVRAIHENKKFRFLDDKPKTVPPRVRVEESKSRVESESDKKSDDVDGEDPNFQKPKYSPEDVMEVCTLATTKYKSTQYSNQVMPFVHNLLAQVSKETLIKAINNVSDMFDNNNRPHDKRPAFDKQFTSVLGVEEMAKRSVTAPAAMSNVDLELRAKLEEIVRKRDAKK